MVQRGTHPNSLANLRPAWKKQPVNPKSGPVITPAMRRLAWLMPHDFLNQKRDKMTVAENVAWVTLNLALQPDLAGSERARTEVFNRLDGMLKPDVIINAEAGAQLNVALVWPSEQEPE
jgi:hypothetical protein